MAYPTTLALITALWSGPARTKSIALWAAIGGAISALGPALRGDPARALLVGIGLPPDAAARGRSRSSWRSCSCRAREREHRAGRQPRRCALDRARRSPRARDQLRRCAERDHARSGCSPSPRRPSSPSSSGSGAQRTRSTTSTWPPARPSGWRRCAGLVVFGSLMGAMYIGQQFLQNVLGYSTVDAGLAILPAVFFMVLIAPRSAKLVESQRLPVHAAGRTTSSSYWAS